MAAAGKVGAVYIQTAYAPEVFTDEATTPDAVYTRYTITDETKRYWDKNTDVIVKVNTEIVTTGYTIEHCGGVIVFNTPLGEEDAVTVSGAYLTVAQAGGFFNWSTDLGMDLAETTTYQSAGWKQHQTTIKEFSVSAEKYWGDEEFFNRLGEDMVIALYIDSGGSKLRYEGFGIISSDGVELSVDEVINESIEIQGTGPLYYREG